MTSERHPATLAAAEEARDAGHAGRPQGEPKRRTIKEQRREQRLMAALILCAVGVG